MSEFPDNNADIVALNLVHHAVIDDINTPGEKIAALLEKMAETSRNTSADARVARENWDESLSHLQDGNETEAKAAFDRHMQVFGDTWAQRWMICHMAKHLYEQLERECRDSPAISGLASVQYEEDGTVASWTVRPRTTADDQ